MSTARKKLIEVALPLEDINRESAREKHIRHGHPSTLHLWWARRPLAACRAVIFASLVDDPSSHPEQFPTEEAVNAERERLFDIIRELVVWENANDERVLNRARAEIMRSTGGNPPPVYDPFCGGGSIPLEAQRLGLEAHASDLNPVPVLINKALIEIPPRYLGRSPVNPVASHKLSASGSWNASTGLADDVRYYGQWIKQSAEKLIGQLYPPVQAVQEQNGHWRHATEAEITAKAHNVQSLTVIAWIWTRTIASPDPAARGTHVPFAKSFWLAKKPGRKTWVRPVVTNTCAGIAGWHFEVQTEKVKPGGPELEGTVSRTGAICILTGSPIPLSYARQEAQAGHMGSRMMAIACEGQRGRIYLPPHPSQEAVAAMRAPEGVPDTEISRFSLGFNVRNYGLLRHVDLFTARQLHGMMTLSGLVASAREQVMKDSGGDADYADALAVYLAFVVDRVSQQFSTLCPWSSHPAHELVITMFARQTLAMPWDFGEINPFCEAASWLKCCDFVAKVLESRVCLGEKSFVHQGDAQTTVAKLDSPVMFCTDPPYYDNIGYADLSDYFYIWMRRSLAAGFPELFGTLLVPKEDELIANRARFGGSRDKAKLHFEQGLFDVFSAIRKKQVGDYPFTVFYAFKQAESDDGESGVASVASTGWETMLEGLLRAGFTVVGTWALRTEYSTGMKAAINSLASSIVLVCRPRDDDAGTISRRDFLVALKRELPEALRNLQRGNIAPVDLAQAAIGPGMAVFSRCARVLEADGAPMGVRTALALINQSLDEVLAEQEGEFDADTRWALAWFDQYGFTEGPYGAAEILCTAKNTSVSGMVEAGILAAKGGKVRLFPPEELPAAWDPQTDTRHPIWKSAHHLIRVLCTGGETAAAELLASLPSATVDAVRDLAYRLFCTCERKKRAKDALAYNSLVVSWPEISHLAATRPHPALSSQGQLL